MAGGAVLAAGLYWVGVDTHVWNGVVFSLFCLLLAAIALRPMAAAARVRLFRWLAVPAACGTLVSSGLGLSAQAGMNPWMLWLIVTVGLMTVSRSVREGWTDRLVDPSPRVSEESRPDTGSRDGSQ